MNKSKIIADIIAKSEAIAAALQKGKDVEIRRTANGITVAEVAKKVVAR